MRRRSSVRHAVAEGLRHLAFGLFAAGALIAAAVWFPAEFIDDR